MRAIVSKLILFGKGVFHMKARLVWLSLLCCAFLFSLSLMVADASSRETTEAGYSQSMALPAQTIAITLCEPQPRFAKSPLLPLPLRFANSEESLAADIVPQQFLSYHKIAYYAFHYSDEAG